VRDEELIGVPASRPIETAACVTPRPQSKSNVLAADLHQNAGSEAMHQRLRLPVPSKLPRKFGRHRPGFVATCTWTHQSKDRRIPRHSKFSKLNHNFLLKTNGHHVGHGRIGT